MRLFCYKARCGDSFHLKYRGISGVQRNIFLDMGHASTYDNITKRVIAELEEDNENVDAIFLSHIHDDHIGGARKYVRDISSGRMLGKLVKQWIYNAPRTYSFSNEKKQIHATECGIVSGDRIYEFIASNYPSDIADYVSGVSLDIDGMKVSIISPNSEKLNLLREKYACGRPLCCSESNDISAEVGRPAEDCYISLLEFDTEKFLEDNNIENGSSLAAIFEYEGKRILWLADSVPSVIINALSLMGYSEGKRFQCSTVILAHHGSVMNNSAELLKMIDADKYIISADGINRYCLPNKETIARLVATSVKRPVEIFFNHNDGRIVRMFAVDDNVGLDELVNIHFINENEAIDV